MESQFVDIFTAIYAGGDESCDRTYRIVMPVFGEFFENVTFSQKECIQKVEDSTSIMMPKDQLKSKLQEIQIDCSDTFVGYLMEVVTTIDETMGIEPNILLDIIVAGVRFPVDMPLKCVANELTSMFPSIMIADGEISSKIHQIVHEDF